MTALTSATVGVVRPTVVRAAHIGLGSFHRAHQVWATELGNRALLADGADADALAGYASYTGRRPDAALRLATQDGLYHLLVKGKSGDDAELVSALIEPIDGGSADAGLLAADPAVSVITLTITEAGYRRNADGGPDTSDPDVVHDIAALAAGGTGLRTAPARIVAAVRGRAAAGHPPLAVVSCDNLIGNGDALARVVTELTATAVPALVDTLAATSFVNTMVDRITPRTVDADRSTVRGLTGFDDAAPVPCEPFTEWLLAGAFPSGHPSWDLGGARFVEDVQPFEHRKLWLLNGAHSLLAYVGGLRGYQTVDAAMGDAECVWLMNAWWDDAAAQLVLPDAEITAYRDALTERFTNPRIRHLLKQIAGDGSQKLPVRLVPVLTATRAAGGSCQAGVTVAAAYVLHLRGIGLPVTDVAAGRMTELASGPLTSAIPRVLDQLSPGLGQDAALVGDVVSVAQGLRG
ncbi:MAG TPA: mannitol dehydrogenase family protein [Actinopolymorphaceae bacterium]